MKALVIYNPTAGVSSRLDVKKMVLDKLAELDYQPILLMLDFDFEANIEKLDLADINLVVAVGGDGTVKVAAREIIQHQLRVPLAVIPFGSANVLASTMKIPTGTKDALALLENLHTQKIDVGLVNKQKYFLVGFSLGYISSVIINTDRELKNRFGSIGYLFKFLWNRIRLNRIKFRIETQNKVFWVRGNSLIVFNAFNFYGFQPKKPISISDGIFNLYVTTNKSFIELFEAALGVLFYAKPPRHIFTLDNRYFKIKLRQRRFLKSAQIDGDIISLPKTIEIEVLSRALEIVIK
jgi:diacylglycerol kinase family enzyme